MIKQRSFFVLLVLTFALGSAGCGHHHTERIIEREVPSSSTTTVVE